MKQIVVRIYHANIFAKEEMAHFRKDVRENLNAYPEANVVWLQSTAASSGTEGAEPFTVLTAIITFSE